MQTFLKKWNKKTIEDAGCYASDEWKLFSNAFKAAIRRSGKALGYEIVGKNSFGQNHYFVSGFIKKGDQYYYISYDYDRYRPVDLLNRSFAGPILWRTAKDDKDYHGGPNNFATADILFDEIECDYRRRAAA